MDRSPIGEGIRVSVPSQPIDVGEYVLHGTQPGAAQRDPRFRRNLTRLLRNVAAIASVLAVVIVGGGVVAAYRTLAGGGPQPEKYAPASTFAFAKVDLDPAAGEKVAAYRFARKFPSSTTHQLKSGDDLRDRLLRQVFKGTRDPSVDYDKDLKPWLGARVGIAGFIDKSRHPQVLGIVAVKNVSKARQSLARLAADNASFAYAVKSDFALLSSSQTALNDAQQQDVSGTLDRAALFRADMHRLGGGQLVTAWADLAKTSTITDDLLGSFLGGVLPGIGGGVSGNVQGVPGGGGGVTKAPAISPQCMQELQRLSRGPATTDPLSHLSGRCRHELFGDLPASPGAVVSPTSYTASTAPAPTKATLTGRIAVGVHLHSNSAELVVHMVGVKHTKPAHSVRDLVTSLPNDTVAAVAATGVSSVQRNYNKPTSSAVKRSLTQSLGLAGFDLNLDDLVASLGDSIVLSVGNVPDDQHQPLVAIRTHSPQPATAQHVIDQLNKGFAKQGSPTRLATRTVGGDLVVTNSSSYADKLQATGHLGDQKRFKDAVGPLPGTTIGLGYVDLRRILDAQPDHGGAAHALTAAAFTLVDTGDEMVLRVRLLAG